MQDLASASSPSGSLCGPSELAERERNQCSEFSCPTVAKVVHLSEPKHFISTLPLDGKIAKPAGTSLQYLLPEYVLAAEALGLCGLKPKLIKDVLSFIPLSRPLTATVPKASWSGNIDLFLGAQMYRKAPHAVKGHMQRLLKAAWAEEPNCCLRLILWLGQQQENNEREIYFDALLWLWKWHPATLLRHLYRLPLLGNWGDLCELLVRACEGDHLSHARDCAVAHQRSSRTKCLVSSDGHRFCKGDRLSQAWRALCRFDGNVWYRVLFDKIAQMFAQQLQKDLTVAHDMSAYPSVCALWCPALDKSIDKRTLLCEGVARKLFPKDVCWEYAGLSQVQYSFRVRDRLRREVLIPLRKALKGSEQSFKLQTQPENSSTLLHLMYDVQRRQAQAISKCDGCDIREALEGVVLSAKVASCPSGDQKVLEEVEAAVVMTSWARRAARTSNTEEFCNSVEERILVLHNTTSLECIPNVSCRAVAAACQLVMAEQDGLLRDKRVRDGELVQLEGNVRHRAYKCFHSSFSYNSHWFAPCHLQQVLKLIFDERLRVSRILVVLDYTVDHVVNGLPAVLANAEQRFGAVGLLLPEIILWNLIGGCGTPVLLHRSGIVQLSGFSVPLLVAALAPRTHSKPWNPAVEMARALQSFSEIDAVVSDIGIEEVLKEHLLGAVPNSSLRNTMSLHIPSAPSRMQRTLSMDLCILMEPRLCFWGAPLAEAVQEFSNRVRLALNVTSQCSRFACVRHQAVNEYLLPFQAGDSGLNRLPEFLVSDNTGSEFRLNGSDGTRMFLYGLDTALSLSWQGSFRFLVWMTGEFGGPQTQPIYMGAFAKGLMRRANALGVQILLVHNGLGQAKAKNAWWRSIEQAHHVGDGCIPQIAFGLEVARRSGPLSLLANFTRQGWRALVNLSASCARSSRVSRPEPWVVTTDISRQMSTDNARQPISELCGVGGFRIQRLKRELMSVVAEIHAQSFGVGLQKAVTPSASGVWLHVDVSQTQVSHSSSLLLLQVQVYGFAPKHAPKGLGPALREIVDSWLTKRLQWMESQQLKAVGNSNGQGIDSSGGSSRDDEFVNRYIQEHCERHVLHGQFITKYIHMDPCSVRFTQCSISPNFQNGQNIRELVQNWLQFGSNYFKLPHIRICWHESNWYALDNRRLAAYRLLRMHAPSDFDQVQFLIVDPHANEWEEKFTTQTQGLTVQVQFDGVEAVIGTCLDSTTCNLYTLDMERPVHINSDQVFEDGSGNTQFAKSSTGTCNRGQDAGCMLKSSLADKSSTTSEEPWIENVAHIDAAAVIDPLEAEEMVQEFWAQNLQRTLPSTSDIAPPEDVAIDSEVPPLPTALVEPILLLEFSGSAQALCEKLGELLTDDINEARKIQDYACNVMSKVKTKAGEEASKRVFAETCAMLAVLEGSRNDAQQELAEIARRQNFNFHTSRPEFAGGAHVYVVPASASELQMALMDTPGLLENLGPRHVIVSESCRPWVEAAVDVQLPSSSGNVRREYRRAPRLKSNRVQEIPRATLSPEVALKLKHVGTLNQILVNGGHQDVSSQSRQTHSTGERPHHEPFANWSWGPVRKAFRLQKHPNRWTRKAFIAQPQHGNQE